MRPSSPGRAASHGVHILLACTLSTAVLATTLQSAAAAPPEPAPTPLVGAFSLGDELEASISERDGAFRFAVPLSLLGLSWDSRALGEDRYGLGHGFGWGTTRIETRGGVRVHPATGGSYRPDPTDRSGLEGYSVGDVRFDAKHGALLPRTDGVDDWLAAQPGLEDLQASSREFAFELAELGGTVTRYSEAGDPLSQITATGQRTDWVWDGETPHRLRAVVNPDGVVTTLDWEQVPGEIIVRAGANLPATAAMPEPVVWRIELDGGRVSAIVDPTGGRVLLRFSEEGLIEHVSGVSGATTDVSWRRGTDGVARVQRVRSTDADGRELSSREWGPSGAGTPSSGWPKFRNESELFWSGDADFRYETTLSDGPTRVVSEYNSLHLLVDRKVVGSTSAGSFVLQEQSLGYPGEPGTGWDPAALPGNWAEPTSAELIVADAHGQTRSTTERFEFDEFGRVRVSTAPDGSVTTTEYDDEVPQDAALPIGLPLVTTTAAPDGLIRQTTYRLNAERSAVTSEIVSEGRALDALVVVSRADYEVAADGFVTEERRFPSAGTDGGSEPRVTRWTRHLDLRTGAATVSETRAAGTPDEATATETTSLIHDSVLESTDEVGNTGSTVLDALGRPVSFTDAMDRETVLRHETGQQHGRNATVLVRPDGVQTTEIRDALGRVIELQDNIRDGVAEDGFIRVSERRDYPEPGTTQVTDAWGATTTTRQDLFGRTVEAVSATGLVQLTQHDDVAHTVTTAYTPTGRLEDAEATSTETLDVNGQVIAATGTRRDGQPVPAATSAFDGLGRSVATQSGRVTTSIEYDALGNPELTRHAPSIVEGSTVDAQGAPMSSSRRFDGFGTSLEQIVQDTQHQRSGGARTVDALGRTVTETDQLDRTSSIEYTADGLARRLATDDGQVTVHTYDPKSRALRLTETTSPVGEAVVTAVDYDERTGRAVAVYDPSDRAGTQLTYEWNDFGDLLRTTYPDGNEIRHRYDAHGRLIETTDIEDRATQFSYRPDGLLSRAVQRDSDDATLASIEYGYDALGRVDRLTRGNGVVTTVAFTSAGQVAEELTVGPDGTTQSRRTYRYDAHGNLLERSDGVSGERGGTTAEIEVRITVYEYDAYDRLIRSAIHDGDSVDAPVSRESRYELSVSGDILAETTTHDAHTGTDRVERREFTYSPLGELTAVATSHTGGSDATAEVQVRVQRYDDAGNLVDDGAGTRYAYDAANRAVNLTGPDGSTITASYWPDGTRRSMSAAAGDGLTSTTTFYWDGERLINDTHGVTGSGGEHAAQRPDAVSYLIGATRHARSTTAERDATSYYGTDRHGSITDLTSGAGAVLEQYRYGDYGADRAFPADGDGQPAPVTGPRLRIGDPAANAFGYAGELTDPHGTQHLSARTYDPETMRFTTMDTALLHNTYAYADLNPITLVDPSGNRAQHDRATSWSTIGFALAGAALTALAWWFAPPVGSMLTVALAGLAMDGTGTALSLVRENLPNLSHDASSALMWASAALALTGFAIGAATLTRSLIPTKPSTEGFPLSEWVAVHKHIERRVELGAKLKEHPLLSLDKKTLDAQATFAERMALDHLREQLTPQIDKLKTAFDAIPEATRAAVTRGLKTVEQSGAAPSFAALRRQVDLVDTTISVASSRLGATRLGTRGQTQPYAEEWKSLTDLIANAKNEKLTWPGAGAISETETASSSSSSSSPRVSVRNLGKYGPE